MDKTLTENQHRMTETLAELQIAMLCRAATEMPRSPRVRRISNFAASTRGSPRPPLTAGFAGRRRKTGQKNGGARHARNRVRLKPSEELLGRLGHRAPIVLANHRSPTSGTVRHDSPLEDRGFELPVPRMRDNSRDLPQLSAAVAFSAVAE